MSGLVWNGDAIARRARRASVEAINETTDGAADVARQLVHVDTRRLQSEIGTVPAEPQGDLVVGAMGVLENPGYALAQEYEPEPRGRAYLHPSADQEYPKLASRIAGRFRG